MTSLPERTNWKPQVERDGVGDPFDSTFGPRRGRGENASREPTRGERISALVWDLNESAQTERPALVAGRVGAHAKRHGLWVDDGWFLSSFAAGDDGGELRAVYEDRDQPAVGFLLLLYGLRVEAETEVTFARFLPLK